MGPARIREVVVTGDNQCVSACNLLQRQTKDFRWHDLRHTWASWHVQNGTPLHALQELGGWETADMVRRYAHLAAEHLAPYADRLSALRLVVGTDLQVTNLARPEKLRGQPQLTP